MSAALAGIRVVELIDRSAALAGRILADLGAEVIMVEPSGGAAIRHQGPFLDDEVGPERGFAHLYFNTNKQSVVLDPDADSAQIAALIASADVLLTTQQPSWFENHGINTSIPGLICCTVTPFGIRTPWRDRKATDIVAGAAGGLIQVSGSPDGTPVQGGANPSYTMSGLAAASAISIAIHQRDFTDSEGHIHIDLSMQEATALTVMQTATPGTWQWYGRIPRRPGLSGAMPCKDGKFVAHLVRPDRFNDFLAWAERVGIDHGMTADDWHYARLDSPREGNPVAETTLKLSEALTRDEFVAGALEADIICLPVLDFPDLEQQEQYIVNDQFLAVRNAALGTELGFVRSPVDAMADGVELRSAPTLGEHQNLVDSIRERNVTENGSSGSALPNEALKGLRIVDFGWVLAAPIGSRILASFGAEVIRVESSTKPDSMRSQPGPDGKPSTDLGGLFNTVNAGKKSFTVNLGTPEGMALVRELISTADIVVNNFRPGAMERMGFGYEALKTLKPDIVLVNLPGAHPKGPWAQRPSMGNILMAASGFNMLTGFEGERPRGVGVAYPDFTSPHLLAATVIAAIRHRNQTGNGQELQLTQLTGMLSLLGAEWMQFKATGEQPPRRNNRSPNYCPHGVYETQREENPAMDSWIALAVESDDEFGALAELMEAPELKEDPRFQTLQQRKANEDELDVMISNWTRGQDKWRLADALQSAGIAAAPVEHLKDMLEVDPQLHRHYQQVSHPASKELMIPVDREAARWSDVVHDLERAPMLGEHNQYVVQDILGHDDETFAELLIKDVLS